MARNAEVTVPFEIRKLGVVSDQLSGGVLEAAIYIAKSRPDLNMKDYVERCLQPMLASPTAGYEDRQFELGAALWCTLGDRRLIDKCVPEDAALEREFREKDSPYTGGERPSMSCTHLYRVTRDPRHLATGIGDFRDAGMYDNCEYWTSTQNDTDMASHIDFADAGRDHGDDKDFPRRVRAIRSF